MSTSSGSWSNLENLYSPDVYKTNIQSNTVRQLTGRRSVNGGSQRPFVVAFLLGDDDYKWVNNDSKIGYTKTRNNKRLM